MTLSNNLKKAIRESGLSLSEIARQTGLARVLVSRFMSDSENHRNIQLEGAADTLADFLGLELSPSAEQLLVNAGGGEEDEAQVAASIH